MSRASNEQANLLHGLVADALIEQIQAWKAGRLVEFKGEEGFVKVFPPTLLAQAIKFLKDNGIDSPGVTKQKADRLAATLPSLDDLDNVLSFKR